MHPWPWRRAAAHAERALCSGSGGPSRARTPPPLAPAAHGGAGVAPATKDANAVHHLYEVVRATMVTHGGVVAPADVRAVAGAIDGISLQDLGLGDAAAASGRSSMDSSVSSGSTAAPATITYLHIHEDDLMTIGIFQLPAGACIPLHNHPGMTVFSRLLYGAMHVRAFDWADGAARGASSGGDSWSQASGGERMDDDAASVASGDSSSSNLGGDGDCGGSGACAARLVRDSVLTAPAPTSVLFPADGGNIHSFIALTPCAVLDVLSPPYAPAAGRECNYYREVPLGEPAGATMGQPQRNQGAAHGGAALVPLDVVAARARWLAAQPGGAGAAADASAPPPALARGRPAQFASAGEPRSQAPPLEQDGDADSMMGDFSGPLLLGSPLPGTLARAATGGESSAAALFASQLGGARPGLCVALQPALAPPDFVVGRAPYRGRRVFD